MQEKLSFTFDRIIESSDMCVPIAHCSKLLEHHPETSWQEIREAAIAILLDRISFPPQPMVPLTATALACFAQKITFILPDEDEGDEDEDDDQEQDEEDDSFVVSDHEEEVETKKRRF